MIIGRIGTRELDLRFWSTLFFVLGIQVLTMLFLGLLYLVLIFGLAFLVGV